MNKNLKFPNIGAIIIAAFSILGVVYAAPQLFGFLDFNVNREFDGAKAYFQTSDEQSKSEANQLENYDIYQNYDLLTFAVDDYAVDETNKATIGQLRAMIRCYKTIYPVMPHVYSDMEDHNASVRNMAAGAVVVFIIIGCCVWYFGLWCGSRSLTDGKDLVDEAKGVRSNVKNIPKRTSPKKSN